MTPLTVQTWNEIVHGRIDDDAAAVALARLHDAPWLANLARPTNRDAEVARVNGWPEAFRMFTEAIIHSEYRPTHGTKPATPGALLVDMIVTNKTYGCSSHRARFVERAAFAEGGGRRLERDLLAYDPSSATPAATGR